MNNDLTIFLPLRGRHLHTLRWLWHADRTGLPFRIIIADGDVHPTIERLLSNPGTFPRLRFSYHRYQDNSFSDFYRKCSESAERIETPYAMISDNDDFVFPSGLMKSISFLNENQDFVCAVGGIPGFETVAREDGWHGVVGPLAKLKYRCHTDGSYDGRNIDQSSAAERVLEELRKYLSLYYSVYRADALKTIMRELEELDFSDLLLHEFYSALRTLTLGKASVSTAYLSYCRQGNTSSGFSFSTDWVDHLLRSRFPQDFQALARRIAMAAVPSNKSDAEQLEADIYLEFAIYIRKMLAGTMMRHRFPRLFAVKTRLLRLKRVLSLPRPLRIAMQERDFWRRLADDGASSGTLASHREEMEQIRRTLTDEDFVRFVMRCAPVLVTRTTP